MEDNKKPYEKGWVEKGSTYSQKIGSNVSSDTLETKEKTSSIYRPLVEVLKVLVNSDNSVSFLSSDNRVITLTQNGSGEGGGSEVTIEMLNKKADKDSVYTKEESDNKYATKETVYTKEEVDSKVTSVFKYKGSVDSYDNLPADNNEVGDTWNVSKAHKTEPKFSAGANLSWDGSKWDVLEGVIDLTNYITTEKLQKAIDQLNQNITGISEKVDSINENIDSNIKPEINKSVKYTDLGEGRKSIALENNDTITGKSSSGEASNIITVSKSNKLEIGDSKISVNLSGSGKRPTYNGDKELSLTEDLNKEVEDRKAAVTKVESDIQSEAQTARAAEKANADAILTKADKTALESLAPKTDLTAEVNRAKEKENQILGSDEDTSATVSVHGVKKLVLEKETEINNKIEGIKPGGSYTKEESDGKYAAKVDTYTKSESDDKYSTKETTYTKDLVYNKTESDNKFAAKENVYTKEQVYTKEEIDLKPTIDSYTKAQVNELLENKASKVDIPTKLPCPQKLTITYNDIAFVSYDGSKVVTQNLVVNANEVKGLSDKFPSKEEFSTVKTTVDGLTNGDNSIDNKISNAIRGLSSTYYEKTEADSKFATRDELDRKVNVEGGKSLISTTDIEKLSLIEAKAQVNKIEGIKVNNSGLEISSSDKSVNIDLSGYVLKTEYDKLVARVAALEGAKQ